MIVAGSDSLGRFTVRSIPVVDGYLARCFEQIVRGVREAVGPRLSSILLVGGFGRGEGSVTVNGSDVGIVNDVDIIVVIKGITRVWAKLMERRYSKQLEKVAAEVCSAYGIKQIDLSIRTISNFRTADMRTIEHQEIKFGHTVLWGTEDPCEEMPAGVWSQPVQSEGTRLFRNRGGGLLLAATYLLRDASSFLSSRENLFVECNKAVIAAGDLYLLLNDGYDWSYRRRATIAKGLLRTVSSRDRYLVESYVRALDWKLAPSRSDWLALDEESGLALWIRARALLQRHALEFESARFERRFSGWIEYAEFIRANSRAKVADLIREVLRGRSPRWIHIAAIPNLQAALVALLLFGWPHDGETGELHMSIANRIVRWTIPHGLESESEWRAKVEEYLMFWHPKGEVGRAIGLASGLPRIDGV